MMTTEKPYGRMMFEALFDFGDGDDSALADDRLTINDSGVYLNRFTKHERQGLTVGEVASLVRHPTGRYDDPVLSFPFGIAELLEFERFYGLIAEFRRYPDGERCTDELTGEAKWLVVALLDVVEGKRTANEVINDETRLKFAPTDTQAHAVLAMPIAPADPEPQAQEEPQGYPKVLGATRNHAATVGAAPVVEASEAIKPLQRGTAQDAAILGAIRAAGHEPQSLPKNPPGKSGIKRQIEQNLLGKNPVFPRHGTQFEKAWERLRKRGDVADKA